MGQTAYTDEQLKKALKKATKAIEIKKPSRWAEHRSNKAFDKTLKNVQKIFRALEAEEGTDANYRIAEAYMAMAEEYEDCVKAYMIEEYMSMAKIYYKDTYRECEGENRLRAVAILKEKFDLLEATKEDGSIYPFFLGYGPYEVRGGTYYSITPLEKHDVFWGRYYVAAKTENGETTYRLVTSPSEKDDIDRVRNAI